MSDQLQLNSLALTKTSLYTASNVFCAKVADGEIYPEEAIAKGKALELLGKAMQDTAKSFLKADKASYEGVSITQTSRANKDYTNDKYYKDLQAEIDLLIAKQKDHCKLIDAVKSVSDNVMFTNPITGEEYKLMPAQITYTPTVTVTVPK